MIGAQKSIEESAQSQTRFPHKCSLRCDARLHQAPDSPKSGARGQEATCGGVADGM